MLSVRTAMAYSAIIVSLTAHSAATAQDLMISKGQEKTIGLAEQDLELDRLKLEDGARVRFAPDVRRWRVQARQAWIGSKVTIDANGAVGSDGSDRSGKNKSLTPACRDGRHGERGETGGNGQNGVDITLNLGLMQFGSLSVHANGGDGGAGGSGGEGAAGGAEDDCHAGSGGNGGQGGPGGDGGAGGEIQILYWSADQKTYIPVSNYGPGIHIENQGGKPGEGGEPGKAGKGGKGGWSKRGSGKLVARDSGEPGQDGTSGSRGTPGAGGKFLIQPMAGPR